MAQNPLVEQAKQGNVNAIASLMNRLLKSQGMLANVERDGDRLDILIESDLRSLDDEVRIPKRDILVGMLKKWFTTLEIQNVSSIKISWQQAGESEPVWTEQIYLVEPSSDIAEPVEKLRLLPLPTLPKPPTAKRDRQIKKPLPIPDLDEMFGNFNVQEQPQPVNSLIAELDADLRNELNSELDSSSIDYELVGITPSQEQDDLYFSDMPSGFDLSKMEQLQMEQLQMEQLQSEGTPEHPDSSHDSHNAPSHFLLSTPKFSMQIIQYCVICAVIIFGLRGLHAVLGSSIKVEKTSIITVEYIS